jgi:hypothetical protein
MGTRVRLTRSGGLAGLSMVASVDLDDLPPAAAKKVRAALGEMDFSRPKHRMARAAPVAFPDGYQYDIEVDDGKKRSLTVRDPVASPEVQALLDVLLPLAEPE